MRTWGCQETTPEVCCPLPVTVPLQEGLQVLAAAVSRAPVLHSCSVYNGEERGQGHQGAGPRARPGALHGGWGRISDLPLKKMATALPREIAALLY